MIRSVTLYHPTVLSVWAIIASFGSYFCMYGFRKPFTASTYTGQTLGGFEYKAVLLTAQVLGYTLAKFIGIRIIAEMLPNQRIRTLWQSIAMAQIALLLFAIIPAPWNFWCLFLNGLPLGLIFGLVLGSLEGRCITEILTAGLCASFILADGVTKSVGSFLLTLGISSAWMPFTAGFIFLFPLIFFIWMLQQIPPPTNADITHRTQRVPMTRNERRQLFLQYAGGLTLLIGVYLLLTILRSIRADFAPEIWQGLGFIGQPAIFVRSEIFVMFGVVAINGLAVLIRNNRHAFFAAMGTSLLGFGLVGTALFGLNNGWMDEFTFMVLIGLGLYLPYVAVHTTVFERLLALTGDKGNIGFLLYLADSFGYLGYVLVMMGRNYLPTNPNFLTFFISLASVLTAAAVFLLAGCWFYFWKRTQPATLRLLKLRDSHDTTI